MPQMNELEFMRAVTDMAKYLGWRYHHEGNSFGTKPGWPDLALFHPAHGALYLELKTGKRPVTEAQRSWIDWLQACGQRAYIVRPDDFAQIEQLLKGDLPCWSASTTDRS